MNDLKWFVAYTHYKSEKKVSSRFQHKGLEVYLPMRKVKSKWSDRIKEVEFPLFTCYVFVRTTPGRLSQVADIDGLARFLSFGNELATVKDHEIELIRKMIRDYEDVKAEPLFTAGQRIRIAKGPLCGLEGILQKEKGKNRFLIAIEGLRQSLSIEIPSQYLASC
ncbi:MAG: UpxY family transcription antiterminator [Lewinellaceae bacterium]|nr:UpxY family transcription antiterminator [Lewinella sp.]MCB9278596.1 UpxY family transcription antiterminator [Lewinellaceae bacterium]